MAIFLAKRGGARADGVTGRVSSNDTGTMDVTQRLTEVWMRRVEVQGQRDRSYGMVIDNLRYLANTMHDITFDVDKLSIFIQNQSNANENNAVE